MAYYRRRYFKRKSFKKKYKWSKLRWWKYWKRKKYKNKNPYDVTGLEKRNHLNGNYVGNYYVKGKKGIYFDKYGRHEFDL